MIRWLAALPFLGMLIGPVFLNRAQPLVLGMPLLLAWLVMWVVLTSAIMAVIYAFDPANRGDPNRRRRVSAALLIIFAFAALALGLGLRAAHGKDMNLEQWTVAGRGFGAIFVFLLLAGEIYTTFTFLGGSGWAYGKGGPTYYILCYGSLAYILSYWLLPPIWRYARAHHLIPSRTISGTGMTARSSADWSRSWGSWRSSPTWCCSSRGSASSSRRVPTGRSRPVSRSGSARRSSRPTSWCRACTAPHGTRSSRTR